MAKEIVIKLVVNGPTGKNNSKMFSNSLRLSSGKNMAKLSSIIFYIDKLRFQNGFASIMYLKILNDSTD